MILLILSDCATVSQGSILSRIKTVESSESISMSLYTSREMNESLGIPYRGNTEKSQDLFINRDRLDKVTTTKKGMALINLTSHQAVAVREEHLDKIVTSNFAIIEPTKKLDPLYFEWYFNENPICRKHLRAMMQGSSVTAISIQRLRSLSLELPSMQDQQIIGNIFKNLYKKKQLLNEQLLLEEQLINYKILDYLQEDNT